MRATKYSFHTLKYTSDSDSISYKLMMRSGMIRKLSSGFYVWLPTGIRVLKKVKKIIHEEMKKVGALEISVPMIQNGDLWKKSGRDKKYGKELFQLFDRSNRFFVLGPTHEETITYLIKKEVISYKQLPINLYQMQMKFRDEIRPSFGVIRSKEFLMKDGYSFHVDYESLQATYKNMYDAYKNIFEKIGIKFHIVNGDNGPIGGISSHEFHAIVRCTNDIKLVKRTKLENIFIEKKEKIRLVDISSIEIDELIKNLSIPIKKTVKTIVVHANKKIGQGLIALMIRGDHQISNIKLKDIEQISHPVRIASEEEIRLSVGVCSREIGPINLSIPLIIDKNVSVMRNFIAGANINGKYFFGINWNRDVSLPEVADLIKESEKCISLNKNKLKMKDIEIGHIFQIGEKYSKIFNATVRDSFGKIRNLFMGCYGIGVTRTIAAFIEQNHDDYGILWPTYLSPFEVVILPINMHRYVEVKNLAEKFYYQLKNNGINTLLEDRNERIGVIFANYDLIGITHFIIISEKNLKYKRIEYKNRFLKKKQLLKVEDTVDFIKKTVFSSR